MTSKKPSGNSPPGDESPNDDDEADGAPPDDTVGDSPTVEKPENKRFIRFEALVAAERKKREKAEQKLVTEQIYNRKLRAEIKVNSTQHDIALDSE